MRFSLLLLALFVVQIQTSTVFAKDLSSRLGIGYSDQFSESLPGMSIRYWPEGKLGFGAALGVDTEDDNSRFGFMARLYRTVFTEENMNFYMGTGAGIISVEKLNSTTSKYETESGFEMGGFFGGEFFFAGLENLGFAFEAGVSV
ncbi:MAG: hypothetical protein AABZ31_04225, partial [Bdellovibrionota bacterium]